VYSVRRGYISIRNALLVKSEFSMSEEHCEHCGNSDNVQRVLRIKKWKQSAAKPVSSGHRQTVIQTRQERTADGYIKSAQKGKFPLSRLMHRNCGCMLPGWSGKAWKKRLAACWGRRSGPCARQSATGVTFSAPGITGGTCGPGRERFSPGFPDCGICRLRPR